MDDPAEMLRRLALHDDAFVEAALGGAPSAAWHGLDPKTLALVRIAVLIATDGAVSSFISAVDRAKLFGASTEEIVGVLLGVAHQVGEVQSISAATRLGAALGLDVSFDYPSSAASTS
jgi:4-carboxymuconolactone decarboxylase